MRYKVIQGSTHKQNFGAGGAFWLLFQEQKGSSPQLYRHPNEWLSLSGHDQMLARRLIKTS